MDWTKLSAIIACAIFAFFIIRQLKKNPEMLSKENLNKSMNSMGFLALGLIAFIALLVMLLRTTS